MSREVNFDIKDLINASAENANATVESVSTSGFETKIMNMAEDTAVRTEEAKEVLATFTSDVEGVVVPFDIVTDQKVVIDDIKDAKGYLSDRVNEMMGKYNVCALPFSVAGILDQVSELKEHMIYELDGVKYAMGTQARREVVKAYRDNIVEQLSSGLPYKKSLFVTIGTGETAFRTLNLTFGEWSFLCSIFREYNPKTVLTAEHDFVLSIG